MICALGITACATGQTAVITHEYFAPTYGPKLLNSAGKYNAVPVEIVGSPFAAPKPAVDTAVMNAVRRTAYGGRVAFTANPEGQIRSPFRLVAIFTPSQRIGHADVCAGSREQERQPLGGLELMMTYCFGEQALSSVRARRAQLDGPADPAFDRFVRNTTATLFQPRKQDGNGPDANDFFD
jgi:hypothetical protein